MSELKLTPEARRDIAEALKRYPHRVLYLIEDDTLIVFAVVHHRRDTPAWHERLS